MLLTVFVSAVCSPSIARPLKISIACAKENNENLFYPFVMLLMRFLSAAMLIEFKIKTRKNLYICLHTFVFDTMQQNLVKRLQPTVKDVKWLDLHQNAQHFLSIRIKNFAIGTKCQNVVKFVLAFVKRQIAASFRSLSSNWYPIFSLQHASKPVGWQEKKIQMLIQV